MYSAASPSRCDAEETQLHVHHIGSPCFSARSFFLLHRHEELQHPLFMGWSHAARVHLQGEEKERFNEIKQELSQISTKFSNNLLVRCIFVPAHSHPDVLQAICQGLESMHSDVIP